MAATVQRPRALAGDMQEILPAHVCFRLKYGLMAATPTEDVIDVSDTIKVLFRSWRTVLVFAGAATALAGFVTWVVPPIYEARFLVLFPRAQNSAGGNIIQLAASSSSDVQYLGGVVKSHEMRTLIAEKADVKVKDVENILDVNEEPERRQLEIAIRSGKSQLALDAVTSVLNRLRKLDEQLLFSLSDRISGDLAKEVEKTKRNLDSAQSRLADFQKTAKTVPGSKEDYSGSEYLVQAEGARIDHEAARRRLQARITQQAKVGQALDLNLPTGDPQITDWRKSLLDARIKLDAARARYQPGTPQVKEAEDTLAFTQNAIKAEVQSRVVSVERGIDDETGRLFAAELTTRWLAEEAASKAKAAPEEAKQYRELLSDVRVAQNSYESSLANFRQESIRNKVEKLQWSVLDEPYLVEIPVNKKFGLNMAAGLVVGGFLGSVFALRKAKK